MAISFERSLRSLRKDGSGWTKYALASAAVLLGLWTAWLFGSDVHLHEVTTRAHIEVDKEVHPVDAPLAGRVVAVHVVLGQQVRAGEVLLELDARPKELELGVERARLQAFERQLPALRAEVAEEEQALVKVRRRTRIALEQARAERQEADSRASFAEQEARRSKVLSARHHISELDHLRAEAEDKARRAVAEQKRLASGRIEEDQRILDGEYQTRLARLRRQLAELQGATATSGQTIERLSHEIDRHLIRAPAEGRVGELTPLQVGLFVSEGMKLAQVIPAGRLRVVAEFPPATALGRIRPGQPARVRLDGFPWAEYGTVAAVVTEVANETREGRIRVELRIAGTTPAAIPLQHGLTGVIEIEVEQLSPAALLLRTAGKVVGRPVGGPASGNDAR